MIMRVGQKMIDTRKINSTVTRLGPVRTKCRQNERRCNVKDLAAPYCKRKDYVAFICR